MPGPRPKRGSTPPPDASTKVDRPGTGLNSPSPASPPPWPRLRQELAIRPGPVSGQGAPTYTLHDPVAHRFFRLGWQEMEIISRWALADPAAIAADIAARTTLEPSVEDVQKVAKFIQDQGLARTEQAGDSARLEQMAARRRMSPFMFLVKNYLFLRLSLCRPDRFLSRTLPLVRPLFTPIAFRLILMASIIGLVLVLRQLTFFQRELEALFSVQGAVMVLAAIGLSKAVHELGHAYAAKLLGLRVPAIGLALMCFYPLLWTDTTEAWKCRRRQDRLLIGLAGVGAELALAALASLAWLQLSPGLMKDMALTLAGVTWVSTLAINANPFMRYDAYYILSDLFEMPMLQSRAFALAKWRLRRTVLGLQNEPPEPFSPRAAFWLVLYAYGTWVYRFFLFLGIAFLVYHMFFKALGLILFLVEIIWFLAWPILKELREWWRLRAEARPTLAGALLLLVLVSLFIPWRSSVVAPAMLDADKAHIFYNPIGARLETPLPPPGRRVLPGQALARLSSPDLDFRLQAAALSRRSLELQMATAGLATELWSGYSAQQEELSGLMAEAAGLVTQIERLTLTAPFAGEIRETAPDLEPGQWVEAREPLFLLASDQAVVEVLVPEEDLARLSLGQRGLFIPGSGGAGPLEIMVTSIAPGALTELTRPALASTKGGPLPARPDAEGRLRPERAVYLVRCAVLNQSRPGAALTGLANLKGRRQSFAARAWDYAAASAIRESGW